MTENLSKEALSYDIDALKNNIDRIDDNIQVFRTEIERMENEKIRLSQMIAVLEAKAV
jgi:predicted  nucleic acid-binding Zn-ribbon protein